MGHISGRGGGAEHAIAGQGERVARAERGGEEVMRRLGSVDEKLGRLEAKVDRLLEGSR